MFGITDYGAFLVAILLFLFLPGPGNLALLSATGKGGIRGGLGAALGLLAGDQILIWLAVAGVAALLAAHPTLFHGMRWLGAAYLAWLGLRLILARPGCAPVLQMRPRHYFRQALVITLLNPKAIIFYMAFFPLFIDPARHQGGLTFAAMALSVALLTLIYCLVMILLVHHLAARLRASPRLGQILEKATGLLLVGFSLRLAQNG